VSRVPLPAEVVHRFRALQERAARTDLPEPTAVVLSTADARGRPSSRAVLLKAFDERGFVFYTNLESRKGRQLRENPRAALTFYWPPLGEQVHVEGDVEPVTDAEADAYFATRPRESRLGAWASRQSAPLSSRWRLLREVVGVARRYGTGPVPRPPHWSGFRVLPDRVEFWKSAPHRLHARDEWTLEDGAWIRRHLYP
jgi:pyridoxamine 5'-phosphate oxidase